MKLYLSSYKFGDNPNLLKELIGQNKKVGIIPNALDQFGDTERRKESENKQISSLEELGFRPEILDLRKYFDKENELKLKIEEYGMIWVLGGNTFVLRIAYKKSGLDKIIIDYSKREDKKEFIYAGYSAGCVVLQNTLNGFELVDDPEATKIAYKENAIWEGVGILSYDFVPHINEDHPESKDIQKVIKYLEKNNISFKPFKDGEVLIENTL